MFRTALKKLLKDWPLYGSVFLLFTSHVSAEVFVVAQDEELTFLSDGRVLHQNSKAAETSINLLLPESNEIKNDYRPTVLPRMEDAYKIYNEMRTDYQEEAQCTNMAHVWVYEEFKRSGLQAQKMFLFFTKSYIRRFRFGWWFHVSPMVQVKKEHSVERVILDRRYTSLPLDPKNWTDHFIKSGRSCREVSRFSDYWNYQQSEDCYLIEATMYDWQPRDVRLKQKGIVKKAFLKGEIQHAYNEAF